MRRRVFGWVLSVALMAGIVAAPVAHAEQNPIEKLPRICANVLCP